MADNTVLSTNIGTGDTIRTLEDGSSIKWPAGVTAFATTVGTPDVLQVVTPLFGLPVRLADGSGYLSALPVTDNGGSLTVDGTVAVTGTFWQATQPVSIASTVTVTGAGGSFPVTDSGGSLTVDAPVATPVFVRLSDGSAAITTLPVSVATVPSHDVTNAGTFAVQAAQSGTWNVTNVSGTVSLPTGAATAAKQPALGTAGTASSDVLTVQGIASMTALKVDGSAVTQPVSGTFWQATQPVSLASVPSHAVTNAGTFAVQESGAALTALQLIDNLVLAEDAAHASGDPGVQALAVRRDTAAASAGTDGDYSPLSVDSTGRLWCNVSNTVTVTGTGGTFPVTDSGGSLTVDAPVGTPVFVRLSDGSSAISTLPVSLASVPSHAVTNAGTFAVQVDGSALTSLQLIDDVVFAEDAGHTTGDKGVQMLAVRNDSDASLCGTTLDYTPLQVDSNGYLKVNIKAGAGSGGTASTDDAAFTAASGSGTPMMGFVTADSVDSGDVGVVGMLANRQLKVTLFDSGGSELSVGGGTQYTEDAAAAANPVGNAIIVVRDDSRAGSLTSADGDNVALRGNNSGELYVKHTDSIAVTDNGGSLTVDGTVAATQSGTWTVLPGNTANTTAWLVTGTGGTFPVTDSGGSLTVDNGGTFAVQATVAAGATTIGKAEDVASADADVGVPAMAVRKATPANTSGTDGDYEFLQMSAGRLWTSATIDAALPAGTNAIGKLAANSGVDIGDVDVTTCGTITPGTAATNLGKAEDAAHASGDVGVMALAVRSNTAASTSGADGDYQPLITNTTGHLWVDASGQTLTVGSHNVTNAGTFAVQVTSLPASTNTIEVVGDAAHDAAAAGNPVLCGAYASAAAPTDVSADADAVRLWALRSGALAVQPTYGGVLASAGNGASGTGTLRVTLANDSTGIVSLTTSTASIGKLASNTGVTIGAVEIAAAQTLGTVTTVSTVTTCSTLTGGGVAHDGADSGNPHKIGAKATTSLAGVTLVANADRTDLYAGSDGVLIVRQDCSLEDVVQERTTNTDGASTAFASGLAAPGAGVRLWIKKVTVCNSSASNCTVDLRDGSGGSVLWTLPVPAGGGCVQDFNPPLKLTANTALAFDASAAISTLTISANGFKSKV